MKQLTFATAAQVLLWAATASCHLGYLDTLDAKHLDNTRHPLDTLDTLGTLDTLDTRRHSSTRTSMVSASTGLDRPRHLY